MPNPYEQYTLSQLMSAGEQSGSQASYYVDREMQRRRELAQQQVDAKVIAAADAQIDAAAHAKRSADAAIASEQANRDTAKWTKISAIAIALSVVVMAVGTMISVLD